MYIKIHDSYRNVVALCDKELIGSTFEEGKRQLECKETFFKGQEITKEEAIPLLQKQSDLDATFSIVGEKSIQTAIEANLITKSNIAHIRDIPFTLILI